MYFCLGASVEQPCGALASLTRLPYAVRCLRTFSRDAEGARLTWLSYVWYRACAAAGSALGLAPITPHTASSQQQQLKRCAEEVPLSSVDGDLFVCTASHQELYSAGVGPYKAPDEQSWRSAGFTQYLQNKDDEFCSSWELELSVSLVQGVSNSVYAALWL